MPGSDQTPPVAGTVLVIARHGQTAWSAEGRFTGWADVPLDDTGRRQAEQLARVLVAARPCLVVTSDLRRAAQTAAAVAQACGVPLRTDPRLREEDVGRWQGLTRAEVAARYPAGFARWTARDLDRYDGREGLAAVGARTRAAALDAVRLRNATAPDTVTADTVTADTAGGGPGGPGRGRRGRRPEPGPVIVVTHSNAAGSLIGGLLGLPVRDWHELSHLRVGHHSRLGRGDDGRWRLLAHDRAEWGTGVSPVPG